MQLAEGYLDFFAFVRHAPTLVVVLLLTSYVAGVIRDGGVHSTAVSQLNFLVPHWQ